ncbi:MAG: hypothetical protein KKI09_12105 [Spirochaetes bacterium]|nr:hypothetical protein [Spirochaetota bacterium]
MRQQVILIFMGIVLSALQCESPRQLLILDSQDGEPYESARLACIEELARFGYSETAGTLTVRSYSLGNSAEFMKRVQALEAGRIDQYDAIVLNGTIALIAARDLWYGTAGKNCLFMNVTDPVGLGVLNDLSGPPKGNFSGVSYPVPIRERLRFLQRILPEARRIGYLYADMPQSWSYNQWLDDIMAEPEFRDLQLVSRKVDFVAGENGSMRMAVVAAELAAQMNDTVDVFLAPNDQLGVNVEFSRRLSRVVSKPIVALGYQEGAVRSGALFSVYPDTVKAGRRVADMLQLLFSGADIKSIYPEQAPYDYILDRVQVQRFGITVPPEFAAKVH